MDDLTTTGNGGQVDITNRDQVAAMQEVQSALIIAKKFKRDINVAFKNIIDSCKRKKLAESAIYSFPKGGQMTSGPSIRLAEVLAQNWGNLDFGIRELEQRDGESKVESYCWDMETNVRQRKVFTVAHERDSKKGKTKLTSQRDIYELVANMGARRLRACILGIIPKDIVDEAMEQCEKTLKDGNKEPIADRVKKMVLLFADLGVTVEMLEKRLLHKLEDINEQEILNMIKIFNSLKDGFTDRTDWFEFEAQKEKSELTEELNEKFSAKNKE
jgi:hypothetical protein